MPRSTQVVAIRPDTAWYTKELWLAKTLRRKLERCWRKTGLAVHRAMYKDQCGVVGRLIWSAKKNYYERALNELPSNQSKLFNLSRRLFGLNNHECANHNVSVNANVSEAFSKIFSEKANNVRTTLKRINQASNTIDPLSRDKPFAGLPLTEFPSATIDEVEATIRRSSSKSCDLDPLPTALLKLCLSELFATLLSIINHSLDTGIVPSHVKKARVTPVPTSRATSYDDVSNYRPISQLPFISKVLERVVTNRIRPHLEEYHLFNKYQSAYRATHSIETALLRVHHDITSALDKGSTVALVMLDQSAAFDVIDHDILLQRLEFAFGVSGRALKWFGSYLQDRSQCVCVGKDVSNSSCGLRSTPRLSTGSAPISYVHQISRGNMSET